MYEQGQGVPQDYAEALCWYRKAVDQSYASAQYNLGNMYYYGRGVPRDPAEAVRWYHKAADQGDEYAQRVLHIKWKGMSTIMKISLSLGFLGSSLLVGSLTPGGHFGGGNRRRSALAGLLVLSTMALDLFGFRCIGILTPLSAVAAFQIVKGLLTGTLVAILLSIVLPTNIWPKAVKTGLVIFGLLFIGNDLFVVSNHKLRGVALALRSFWSINGMLLGTIVSLAIVLWLTTRSRAGTEQQ
jgi:tetratricopeptide (TPR) repeat protein